MKTTSPICFVFLYINLSHYLHSQKFRKTFGKAVKEKYSSDNFNQAMQPVVEAICK